MFLEQKGWLGQVDLTRARGVSEGCTPTPIRRESVKRCLRYNHNSSHLCGNNLRLVSSWCIFFFFSVAYSFV